MIKKSVLFCFLVFSIAILGQNAKRVVISDLDVSFMKRDSVVDTVCVKLKVSNIDSIRSVYFEFGNIDSLLIQGHCRLLGGTFKGVMRNVVLFEGSYNYEGGVLVIKLPVLKEGLKVVNYFSINCGLKDGSYLSVLRWSSAN